MVQLLWKTICRLQKNLKELVYDPAITFQCIYPKDLKSGSQRAFGTLVFGAALFTIARMWEQPNCPQKDKYVKNVEHTKNGILFGL